MPVNRMLLLFLAVVYSAAEGLLLIRDRKHKKGSTKADQMTRLLNFLGTESALLSAFFVLLIRFNFNQKSLLLLTLAGTALAICGLFLRYSSIHILGKYFRTTVEIDRDQPVIQSGPYRLIRHPSYSGILLFFLGYGIVSQNWLCLAVCATLPFAALSYRIKVEEAALVRELGANYEEYRTRTKKLIPFVW